MLVNLVFSIVSGVKENTTLYYWINFCVYAISFVLIIFFVRLVAKLRGDQLGFAVRKTPLIVYLFLLLISPLLIIVISPLTGLIDIIPLPEDVAHKLAEFKDKVSTMVSFSVPSFLTTVIAAPILEELFCRGIILEGLLKNKITPVKAVLWSAIIFVLLHFNPYQIIHPFLVGCFLGWVYYSTRSLITCIFIHYLNNGLTYLMLFIFKNPDLKLQDIVGTESVVWVYLISFIVLGSLIYILNKYFSRKARINT